MTLYLDGSYLYNSAFNDLYTITSGDANLGYEQDPNDSTVYDVTYAGGTPAAAPAARVYHLVQPSNYAIVITAVDNGMDPYFGGGQIGGPAETYVDTSVSPIVVRVIYDMTQCNGNGLFAYDASNQPITAPNSTVLFHELAHAYYYSISGNPTDTQGQNEVLATQQENVLRQVLKLCQRSTTNHGGGCGPGSDCGAPPAPSLIDNGCFIVSAATGSPASAEVTRLRQLRDRVGATSGLAAQLIDVIYDEYYQFSPAIAANLVQDAAARAIVLRIVVQPLLAWYSLAAALTLDLVEPNAFRQAAHGLRAACPRYIGADAVADLLETIRAGKPLPANTPRGFVEFAPSVQLAARLPFAAWAILDPLVRAWTSAAGDLDIIDQVSQWLATAPLERLAPPSDPDLLDEELAAIAELFKFKPAAQELIGERLIASWPHAADGLKRHGFGPRRGSS